MWIQNKTSSFRIFFNKTSTSFYVISLRLLRFIKRFWILIIQLWMYINGEKINKRPMDHNSHQEQFQINKHIFAKKSLIKRGKHIISYLRIDCVLFVNTWIPFTEGYIVPSLIEIGPVILEKKIFKLCQCIFSISLLPPLGKGCSPSLVKTLIIFTQKCFMSSLIKIDSVILKKKMIDDGL